MEREDWLRAARTALLRGGPSAVRVEVLARKLRVTKGSFYWHFKDRNALLEELLREWEAETSLLHDLLAREDFAPALDELFDVLSRNVVTSERGQSPSDAAVFAWAAVSPKVAARANREEQRRIALLQRLAGDKVVGEFIYLAYLGFLLRRRRVPEAAKSFPIFAKVARELLLRRRKK